jgi:hypothetical protein
MKKALRFGEITVSHVLYLALFALVIFWILEHAH